VARRPGDVAVSLANPQKAQRLLGWATKRELAAMCADSWRWQQANPKGFE
jgi:UDP-glucose 4-epimerase